MPKWIPTREWANQEAILIGGGTSLETFDFSVLKGTNTIGCNDAFHLGPEIVKICFFGDASWFHRTKWDLEKWPGRIATCSSSLAQIKLDWLLQLDRVQHGLHTGSAVGWNYSTGAAAVNLAILLGATRIYLLGFDMGKRKDGRTHWHTHNPKSILDSAFQRFLKGFLAVQKDLVKLPQVKVFNVTDGSSALPYFVRIPFEEFYKLSFPSQQRQSQPVSLQPEQARATV